MRETTFCPKCGYPLVLRRIRERTTKPYCPYHGTKPENLKKMFLDAANVSRKLGNYCTYLYLKHFSECDKCVVGVDEYCEEEVALASAMALSK